MTWPRKKFTGRTGSAAAGTMLLATAGLTPAAHRRRLETARLQVRRLEFAEPAFRRKSLQHQQRTLIRAKADIPDA
ncbi:hypothetical protein [Streptomyces lancefieldiae]|uniref:Uncharacterized protein n=1 Tax=Streptomyces lancefieldiae TaxID=3075520 RepID=A0ABU3AQ49_9ACTN|nr:hypothetical protein [Streptomyces sp. DSM 40712]MDT0612322.1 hypothetical protein [Streptomyces sp. DSM 40712]